MPSAARHLSRPIALRVVHRSSDYHVIEKEEARHLEESELQFGALSAGEDVEVKPRVSELVQIRLIVDDVSLPRHLKAVRCAAEVQQPKADVVHRPLIARGKNLRNESEIPRWPSIKSEIPGVSRAGVNAGEARIAGPSPRGEVASFKSAVMYE